MQATLDDFTGDGEGGGQAGTLANGGEITVYATPTDEEGDFLPFWRNYIEEHYQPKRVIVGRYRLIERDGRRFIGKILAEIGECVLFSDGVVSERLGVREEAVRDTLTHGSVEDGKELLKAYLEKIREPMEAVEEDGDGYVVVRMQTPTEAFEDDVLQGKILDPATGLKLSLRQAKGRPPESGLLQEVTRFFVGEADDYKRGKELGRLGYARGVVVKICGDYDPSLREHHNTWAVITRVIDAYHYLTTSEWTAEQLIIRDTDVKGIIGTLWHDFVGIGPERHRREVVPIIEKALRGKIPVPKVYYTWWPRPPLRQALVVAYVDYGFDKPLKYLIRKALAESRKRLEEVKKKREMYEPKDFRLMHGKALLWIRLYEILSKRVERLEKHERVCMLFRDRRDVIKEAVRRLRSSGIPYKIRGSELFVLKEDYKDAWRALTVF